MDYRALFGSTAKWVAEIEAAKQIPEVIYRAFHIAVQGRPGPVVVVAVVVVVTLPEDMLVETAEVVDAPRTDATPIWPGLTQMANCRKFCGRRTDRQRSWGGPGWIERAGAAFARFAERFEMPVVASFHRASVFRGSTRTTLAKLGCHPILSSRRASKAPMSSC
jgi:acetolactate synthase-1/2/3 large subunit